MTRETIVILGIPVDNLDMDETVEGIFDLIEAYRCRSGPPAGGSRRAKR